ncbi:MAG: PAS domain S-box protein [Arcobacter sp.]|uniref:PAS domain-containing sensor histidine kinase n=1 Tax=Arcobacter sp. TaxID=1872629 RepID=UPI003AFFED8C
MTENPLISSKLFFNLINQANDLITIYNMKESTIIYANKKFLDTLEYTMDELSTLAIDDIREAIDEKDCLNEILLHDKITTYSNFYSKSKKKFILESNIQHHSEDNIDYMICISRDVTEKLKKEQILKNEIESNIHKLENQKIFLNTLLDSNPTSIFYKSKEGKYLGCNKAWEKLTGIKVDSIIGKSVFDIAPLDIAQIYHEQDEKVFKLEENPQVYQSEVYNKNLDKRFNVVFYKSAYFDINGDVLGLIGVVIDTTDITTLEEEKKEKDRLLYHKSKMEAMGEMIENIAHQWRQPLSAITTSASGIKLQKEFGTLSDENLIKCIDIIVDTSNHLSSTIDDFRNFFKQTKEKNTFNIEEPFKKALKLLSAQLDNKNIELIKNIDNIEITSLENELIHVILNILNNAIDAYDNFDEKEFDKKYIFIDCYKENDFLNIEIKDNAKGIKDEIIDRIFEPYFTTKHRSDGTGIGLFMTQEIVHKHLGGDIEVEKLTFKYDNNIYTGSKFIIKLEL